MDNVKIRAVKVEDAFDIAAVFSEPSVFSGTMQSPYPTEKQWQERIARLPSQDIMLVAEVEGSVVGHAGLHRQSGDGRSHAAILGMAVRADMQGRGIGTALLNEVLTVADRWTLIGRIELVVLEENDRAINLYRKFGFVEEGRHPAYSLRAGQYKTAIAMGRLNADPATLPKS
jgi:putative acetyltransferase